MSTNLMTGIPVTYYYLGKWQAKLFKKLGWMLLMRCKVIENPANTRYAKYYNSKLTSYMNCIQSNCDAITNKIAEAKGQNLEKSFKVLDLQILCDDAVRLCNIAKGCLPIESKTTLDLAGGARRRSKKSSKKSSKTKKSTRK